MDADQFRAYMERSAKQSGVPVKVADKSALIKVASIIDRKEVIPSDLKQAG